ncbi:MAG: hypothetical protein OEV30_10180, partial [Ignavibacteria bacterium]|nr:hypothetical protein [Ignavibacteria bacterium]
MKHSLVVSIVLVCSSCIPKFANGQQTPLLESVLYDNGPLVTHVASGFGGADVSAVQNLTLGLSEYGFCHWGGVNNKVSDEFVVTDQEGWTIDTLTFYGFQTGNSTQSTYLALQWWIYDDDPAQGGTLLCTDSATVANGRLITGWSGVYRTMEDDMQTATNRAVMLNQCVVDPSCDLGPGTYWVVSQGWGTIPTCMWYPLVSIVGTPATGNAQQFLGSANDWFPIMDGGYPQGIPLLIQGSVSNGGSSVPCEDIFFFKAKCNTSGTAQSMVKITGDYAGETVMIGLDG